MPERNRKKLFDAGLTSKVSRRMGYATTVAALLSGLAFAATPALPTVAASTGLDRLNAWRSSVNLSPLSEDTTWSQGDYDHSLYMVKNDQVTHYELSTLPYYTVAGDTAARNGNIEVNSTTTFGDDQAIDWWMAAPFHAMGMMDPRLTVTGFGSYREVKSGWQAGFTLDVLRGNPFTGGTWPVFFPGDGSSVPLSSYSGNEFPDPLQACPGYSVPVGLPLFIEVGGNVSTSVGAHSLTGNGVPQANCVIDSSNPSVGSNLTYRGGVIMIPQQPLIAGTTYAVSMTVNGIAYHWSFGVTADNTIIAPTACAVTVTLPAIETTTSFGVPISAGTCSTSGFDVQAFDVTLNQGWIGLGSVGAVSSTATLTANGYPGHTYQFRARSHSASGLIGGWTVATTQVSATATKSHAWSGLYTLDGYGGVQSNDSPPLSDSAYWGGWNIARAAKALPGGNAPQSGFVLDGYGGLHSYGGPAVVESGTQSNHRWGWDIARDFAFLPDGTGGFVLDGYGGLHGFRVNGNTAPLTAVGGPYWAGWDIARKVVIWPDGTGGYVLDGYGGVHPFGINGPAPAAEGQLVTTSRWNWDIARDIVLVAGNQGHSGYVLDGYGGTHPFHPSGDASGMPGALSGVPYWGWDIARGIWMLPASATSGYVLDGWGGIHPFGGAPAITSFPYWPGWDIAKSIWGA
jgi:cysteine-rich secretory family protein